MTSNRPYLEVTWTDPETGHQGYVVIDTIGPGVAAGGLRVREGCTLQEVRDLARGMTLKEAVVYTPGDHYAPLGGAKGAIDISPHDPAYRGVLRRYLEAMRPLIETCFATGEDLGIRQELIDETLSAIGVSNSAVSAFRLVHDGPDAGHRRLAAAFSVGVDGIGLADIVGGYGVARAAGAYLA